VAVDAYETGSFREFNCMACDEPEPGGTLTVLTAWRTRAGTRTVGEIRLCPKHTLEAIEKLRRRGAVREI
jgi:hypothetical protein